MDVQFIDVHVCLLYFDSAVCADNTVTEVTEVPVIWSVDVTVVIIVERIGILSV